MALSLVLSQTTFADPTFPRLAKWPTPLFIPKAANKSLSPLESALPKIQPITPLQSADPKTLHLKSFRIRRSQKGWGGRGKLLTRIEVSVIRFATATDATFLFVWNVNG